MRIQPELGSVSIVLIGNFNPAIFQPAWLAKHDLISSQAAETAQIGIVHPELTSFGIEGSFTLQVERERFAIDRTIAPFIVISDMACKIFEELLPHTPIKKLGINRLIHFDAGSPEIRDRIGERLAPREPWGEWGTLVSSGEGRLHGGLRAITMIQNNVSDRPAGWIQAKLEPSLRIKGGRSGIFMEVNDHYEVSAAEDAGEIIAILAANFDRSIRNSENIIDQIMGLVHEHAVAQPEPH